MTEQQLGAVLLLLCIVCVAVSQALEHEGEEHCCLQGGGGDTQQGDHFCSASRDEGSVRHRQRQESCEGLYE